MNFNEAALVPVKGNKCRHKFWISGKTEAVNKMKNADVNEKGLG